MRGRGKGRREEKRREGAGGEAVVINRKQQGPRRPALHGPACQSRPLARNLSSLLPSALLAHPTMRYYCITTAAAALPRPSSLTTPQVPGCCAGAPVAVRRLLGLPLFFPRPETRIQRNIPGGQQEYLRHRFCHSLKLSCSPSVLSLSPLSRYQSLHNRIDKH